MNHVLVVEDDPSLRRTLVLNLQARGYTVDDTGNGEDALALAGRHEPQIALVDLGLPTMSGLAVVTSLLQRSDVAVIVVSARDAEQDKVQALDLGAHDYITKPFGIEELMARIRAATRTRVQPSEPIIVTAEYTIDLDERTVVNSLGASIHLTPIECGVLARLVRARGALVERNRLMVALWGRSSDADANALRVHLANLRRKLETDLSAPQRIITEPGVGYRFVMDHT